MGNAVPKEVKKQEKEKKGVKMALFLIKTKIVLLLTCARCCQRPGMGWHLKPWW